MITNGVMVMAYKKNARGEDYKEGRLEMELDEDTLIIEGLWGEVSINLKDLKLAIKRLELDPE